MKRIFAISTLLIFTIVFGDRLYGQEKQLIPITKYPRKDTLRKITSDTSQQKDLDDVLQSLFTKNYKPTKMDTIGRKPIISFIPAVGYSLQTKAAGTLTGNIVFRSSPTSKVSSITTSMGFTQRKQFTLPIVSSIWTNNNKFVFLGDARFYIYPQSTFGLGSNSNIADEDPMRYDLFRFSEVVMRQITGDFYLGVGYKLQQHWNITHNEPLDGAPSDYENYGAQSHTTSSGFSLNALYDSRDNSVNASKGFYASVQYYTYDKIFASDDNWQSLIIDVRKYFTFPENSENVIAFWSYDWVVLHGKPPYLDLPSTSWDTYSTTGRGYIQSRFRGAQMVYAETEYRFKISRNGLIGGVVFLNGESFSAAPGTKLESIQPGYGPGLRIKLSKVSKTNLDIDYGFGNQGSRGLFLTVGEVF
ncbi:MAG TPA: BamA/TamA family outer membrane protein [Mucilaginibacter sp.]